MGLWLILCNRSGSVAGSTRSETAEWTSAGGPRTPHAESKAVHFQIHLFSSAVIKKKQTEGNAGYLSSAVVSRSKLGGLLKVWCRNVAAFKTLTSLLTHIRCTLKDQYVRFGSILYLKSFLQTNDSLTMNPWIYGFIPLTRLTPPSRPLLQTIDWTTFYCLACRDRHKWLQK